MTCTSATTTTTKKPSIAECEPFPERSLTVGDRLLCVPGTIFEIEEAVIDGRRLRVWKNTPLHFRSFLEQQLRQWKERPFLSSPCPLPSDWLAREELTYGDVHRRAIEQAAWLRAHGVQPGLRVAIGGLNSAGWIVAYVATHYLGAVPVLLNSTLQVDAQIHCLRLTQPVLTLVDEQTAAVLGPVAKILLDNNAGKLYSWSPIAHLAPAARAGVNEIDAFKPSPAYIREVEEGVGLDKVHAESDAIIFFTSGTTSMPKAVLESQRGSLSHLISVAVPAARAGLRMGLSVEDAIAQSWNPPPKQATALLPVPLFHVTGALGWLLRLLHVGSKVTFMRRWSVPEAIKLMVDQKITVIGGVPAIVTAVLRSPLLPRSHAIEGITYGGSPPPQRLAADITQRWPLVALSHGFGMTETNGIATCVAGPDYLERPESVGHPNPISDIKIVDPESKKPLPPGEVGLLLCHGSNLMKGYVDNPKATAEVIDSDGWLNTGDVGMVDAEGFLYIRDRAKDVIIRGGENIASAEVENAVYLDNRIFECAAVPVPDPVLGERVAVCVSLAPGMTATPQSVLAAVQPRLRHPAQPVLAVVLPRALPRNANGKIVKADVKKIVGAMWEKQQQKGSVAAKL